GKRKGKKFKKRKANAYLNIIDMDFAGDSNDNMMDDNEDSPSIESIAEGEGDENKEFQVVADESLKNLVARFIRRFYGDDFISLGDILLKEDRFVREKN